MPGTEKLAGLLAVVLFLAAGWGWSEVLPSVRRLPFGARWACRYLLGLGWVAGALYVFSHLWAVPLRRPAVLAIGILPVIAGASLWARNWRTARQEREPISEDSPKTMRSAASKLLSALALFVGAAITLAVLCEALTHPPRDWDGRMTWGVQAKFIRAAGTVDAPVLRDPAAFVSLTHYPLLMPIAQVAALEIVGAGEDDPAFRPLYVAFLPVFLAMIAWAVRSGANREERVQADVAAALTVLLVALLPFLAFYIGGGASSSYSDLPLACFYGAGLLLLLQPRLDLSSGIAGGLLLACAAITKDEGGPLALAALFLAAMTWWLRRRFEGSERSMREERGERPALRSWAPLLAAGVLVALALLFLAHWRAGIPLRYTPDYRAFLAERGFFASLRERAPLLVEKVRLEMTQREFWGYFWWIAPVVLLAGRRGLRRVDALALALATLAPLSIVTFVYAITDIPAALPGMTWNRFLLQAGIPCFTLFGWALADLLTPASRRP